VRSLSRLASSVLCVGFEGKVPDEIPAAELRDLAPAGLIVFSRNVSDAAGTRALCEAAVSAAGGEVPAFVGVDQEGGRVARFVQGAAALPSMLTLGAAGDAELTRRTALALALDVRSFGASVDFAPVLDLAIEPSGSAIGTRSLGADPAQVARLGGTFIGAMQSAGVAAAAKHFPGHGAARVDSHVDLPVLDVDIATLHHRELVPFAAAIDAGVKAVMTAHVAVAGLDPLLPATLSRELLTGILRDELGFDGVCITDSMEMGAIAKRFGTPEAVVRAIAAGADCALVSHSLDDARQARDAIVAAVECGELPLERLSEAAARVAGLRAWCARAVPGGVAAPGLPIAIARRALRVVRGRPSLDADSAVTVISFEGTERMGVEDRANEGPSLSLALRRLRVRSEQLRVPLDPSGAAVAHLREVLGLRRHSRLVIVMRRADRHPRQHEAILELLGIDPEAIVISALEPFDAGSVPEARNVLCTFGDQQANIDAAAEHLIGRA
jgi:beta-N-acetylhexosaminidase